ncbi:short-chain collagen C4-like [Watersipora subatra]|uniref:short-chain collagen C4-like n=1 Tax=Watersipora subatra TaxID=2589382 RepID=UPI00355BB36E
MEKFSTNDDFTNPKDKKPKSCQISGICWLALMFCIVCISFIIFGIYILQSIQSARQEVTYLTQKVDRLQEELDNLQWKKVQTAEPRRKRQTGTGGELPITAYESSNLVKSSEVSTSRPLGAPGQRSEAGAPGQPGEAGAPGQRGATGAPGQPGRDSPTGPPGRPGSSSPSGPKGETGTKGTKGSKGVGGRPGSASSTATGSGSTFIRWGRTTCPQVADLVYAGYAAAANPGSGRGGSTELECLSTSPSWHANSVTSIQTPTKLFAAKFSLGRFAGILPDSADNSVITCSVCITAKAPVITLPGRVNCLSGWHKEYNGYLMATSALQNEVFFSSKNYCVDKEPDYYEGHNDSNGLKLTFLQAGGCYRGLYPCHEYTENNLIACTVCSKDSD